MIFFKKSLLFLSLFLLLNTPLIAQNDQSSWIITADNIDPANYYGVTVANGMIGLVSSPEPLKMSEIVLNGVYDYYGRGRVSNILKGFNFAGINLDVDGIRINSNNIGNLRQTLDMKRAVITTEFDFENKVTVRYSVRALRHLPFTSLIDLEVTAHEDVEIAPANTIEAPDILRDVRNYYAEIDRPHVRIPLLTSVAQSPTGKHTVAASCSYIFEDHEMPRLVHEDWDHNRHLVRFKKNLKKGETFRFSVAATETSTEHFEDPHNEAERLSIYAALQGTDKLLARHEEEWETLWQSDIIIEGNIEDQRDVRFALYHLYSFAREGTAYSLSPMGLSGLGYNGHVFWDTELWMYPPLLILQPQIAKSLLDYRFERLDEAKRKAFSHGFEGAMFPWESDDTGQEATPVWALSGPFEHHITGTIAFAYWNYYRVTKDKEWLAEKGYPMLKEIARFWVSRVERGEDGKYHINNVVGADEWAENIDDNAFTNGIAISALQYAVKAAGEIGEKADPQWSLVAANIPILKMNNGVTMEHATYRGEDIKQADVNLLAYPLNIVTDPGQIEKDLTYYEPRIGQGPAMSHSVLSVLYSRLGNPEKAYELFKRGYIPNEVPPFGVLAESAGGTNPYFATGAGGMLQAVLAGFGGLELTDDGIVQLDAQLPRGWEVLTIRGAGPDEKNYYMNAKN